MYFVTSLLLARNFLLAFTVQFSRCRCSDLFQDQIEMLFAEHFNLNSKFKLVGPSGLEPPTSRLSVVRSSQLSYGPISRGCTLKIKHCKHFSRLVEKVWPWNVRTKFFICSGLHRKEVIQPHLPIRLPCYDFTPIANPTFGSALLAVRLLTSGITGSHGVTGGVYKARERIHRGMLIRDY